MRRSSAKQPRGRDRSEQGVALVMVLMMASVGFLMLAGLLARSTQSGHLAWRSMALTRSSAAADAALEATVSAMVNDLHSSDLATIASQVNSGYYGDFSESVGLLKYYSWACCCACSWEHWANPIC